MVVVLRRPFKIWSRSNVLNPNLQRYNSSLSEVEIPSFPDYLFISRFRTGFMVRRVVLRSSGYAYLTREAIEAFRKVISPHFRKRSSGLSKFYIRCYAYLPLIKKPAEVRIGGGKGSKLRTFVCPVKPGQILFEITFRPFPWAFKVLHYAARKLNIKVAISVV